MLNLSFVLKIEKLLGSYCRFLEEEECFSLMVFVWEFVFGGSESMV